MTDLGKLCERVYRKIEWQKFPSTFTDEEKEKMISDAVVEAIRDLFVVTGRVYQYYDYEFIYDTGADDGGDPEDTVGEDAAGEDTAGEDTIGEDTTGGTEDANNDTDGDSDNGNNGGAGLDDVNTGDTDTGDTSSSEQTSDEPAYILPSEFTYTLLLDEELYVICCAQIDIFGKIRAQYNDLLGYTTNALTVTNADKPYSYLTGTIAELEDQKKMYYYKMVRFSHLD